MKVLAFDQSTRKTGWSLFEDGQYVKSGVISLGDIEDTEERSKQMGLAICKRIAEVAPEAVVIENVQNQSNVATVILLARLQGVILGYCHANNIRSEILGPTQWRAALHYNQGRGVKRTELKKQSRDFVKKTYELTIKSEDENEAIAINAAAHRILDFDIWGI